MHSCTECSSLNIQRAYLWYHSLTLISVWLKFYLQVSIGLRSSGILASLIFPGFFFLLLIISFYFSQSVQSLSPVWLFETPWTAAHQSSLSITNSCSLLKLMSIESVMPSNHLILCHPLLLLPSIFPSIRVFSNESVLCIRWPNTVVSPSESILPMNI